MRKQNMHPIHEDFTDPSLSPHWKPFLRGRGTLERTGHTLCFVTTDATRRQYTDAQIDDYQGLPRGQFPWRAPLTMTVHARFSHGPDELTGTAGFGFWNDPFMMTGARRPTLPRAIWFFYGSPRSNMKLDLNTPGHGWKAATIDALGWPFLLLAPTAPVGMPLMHVRPLYRRLWPLAQRALRVCEALIQVDMTAWHTYTLEWGTSRARFLVDDRVVLDCDTPPRGRLGCVIWLDNQYAVVTPGGRLGYGLLDAPGCQWMELEALSIEPGT